MAVSPDSHPTATLDQALAHAARLLDREPALALAQADEILRSVGPHPPALLLRALANDACGRSDLALGELRTLARQHPAWAAPRIELGLRLGRSGRGDEAIAELRAGLALSPTHPTAWLALGDHLGATGDSEAADAAYAHHVRHASGDPRLMAAADALIANRIPEAEALLKAHLQRSPTDVAAIRMLAEVAARLGRLEDSEVLLDRCVQLAPRFQAARQNYAMVLHRANKPAEALAQIDHLLADDPGNASARNLKAVVLCRIGDYLPAIELYDGILAEYPDHGRIWLSFGHALKTAGLRDRAIAAYRRSIALDPGFGEAYWSLANLKTFRFEPADLHAMAEQLERSDLDAEQRCQFEFALGKAHEDAGDYAASFAHYDQGNRQRRASLPYRPEDATTRVRRSRELFTPDFLARRTGQGHPAPDPIFVVGLPRSGSTLVEQILSSHSAVEGTMELPEVIALTHDLRREGSGASYHDVLATLDADRLRELGERYLARTRVQRKTDAPHFIDKMPNNFFHAGLIHLMLPNARIVDVRRHPLACCFSGYKQYFARGQNFSYGLDDIGRYYRDYLALMAHFDQVLPGRIHRVVYEDLVQDTEAQVRALLDYCGLPFEPGCLRFFENARPVRTASSEQVRQPIYREGLDHWRHYEPWLGPLKQALGPALDTYPDAPPHSASDPIQSTTTTTGSAS
ncbi:sulfotransferase [Arenimonas sp. MALMAid1274]|uniref:sulfotransferase n=1 Tax=Arenimonas sp. MALMAid1274 TaxID=3411630 RepID=UPI003BA29C34